MHVTAIYKKEVTNLKDSKEVYERVQRGEREGGNDAIILLYYVILYYNNVKKKKERKLKKRC